MNRFRQSFAAALLVFLVTTAAAQGDFPSRPVRIIVANTPGSTVDLIARKLGEGLTATLGQPIVILNHPGAGGLVGQQMLAQSAKDGYTLGFYGNTAVIAPHLQKNLSFDPIKDITTVAIVGNIPFVAVVPQSSPIRDIPHLIELAKRSTGAVKMGTAGAGTAIHLAAMQFQSLAGVEMLHVPYKGVAPMQLALVSGEVDVGFPTVGSVAPLVQQGRLRALGTTGRERAALLSQTPTIAEAGLPAYALESWLAMAAPAGVPVPILQRIANDLRSIVAKDDIQQLFAQNAITPGVIATQAAQKIVDEDYARMGKLVAQSGAKAN
jgi:tripartite-type tricarboxylate transporter receptor subunit TctC